MNIAVWCGASTGSDPSFMQIAREVGKAIGREGHTLVYGGCDPGLMGAIADSCLEAGGSVLGITTHVEKIFSHRHKGLTENLVTSSLADRKSAMRDLSDVYLVLPGGLGTLDELSDVLALVRVGVEQKRMALYSPGGFYEPLEQMFRNMIRAGFTDEQAFEHLMISDDLPQIARFLTTGNRG